MLHSSIAKLLQFNPSSSFKIRNYQLCQTGIVLGGFVAPVISSEIESPGARVIVSPSNLNYMKMASPHTSSLSSIYQAIPFSIGCKLAPDAPTLV